MTMHKGWYPRDEVDRLYVSRKEGGREIANIEDIVDASMQRLEDYIENCWRRLFTVTRNDTDNTRINRIEINRKQKWKKDINSMDF